MSNLDTLNSRVKYFAEQKAGFDMSFLKNSDPVVPKAEEEGIKMPAFNANVAKFSGVDFKYSNPNTLGDNWFKTVDEQPAPRAKKLKM